MYNASMSNPSLYKRKLGTPISKFEKKLCGSVCITVMLIFLIGPFVIFSDSIAQLNPVIDSKISLGIVITENFDDGTPQKNYEFPLFHTESSLSMADFKEDDFKSSKYHEYPETKFFTEHQV